MAEEETHTGMARPVLEEPAGKKETSHEAVEIPEEFGPVQLVVDDHKIKTFAFTQDGFHEAIRLATRVIEIVGDVIRLPDQAHSPPCAGVEASIEARPPAVT